MNVGSRSAHIPVSSSALPGPSNHTVEHGISPEFALRLCQSMISSSAMHVKVTRLVTAFAVLSILPQRQEEHNMSDSPRPSPQCCPRKDDPNF